MSLATLRLDDGRTLSYRTLGPANGRTLMLFHSLPGSDVPPAFVAELLDEFGLRLVAPARPGFGLSDFQPGRTVADWPSDVTQLADALELDRFLVLGVSAGSPYVVACCAAIPERIERAAIAVGITPYDRPSLIHAVAPAPIGWAVRRSRVLSTVIHRVFVGVMRRKPDVAMGLISKTAKGEDARMFATPEVRAYICELAVTAAERGVRGWVYEDWMLSKPWAVSPSEVSKEARFDLWYGDHDSAIETEHAQAFAESLPNATLHLLPGEGHFSVIFKHSREILGKLAD